MCEERGGSVACDATFGTDPLVMRADLIESHETLSQYATFRTKQINLLMLFMVKLVICMKEKRQYL